MWLHQLIVFGQSKGSMTERDSLTRLNEPQIMQSSVQINNDFTSYGLTVQWEEFILEFLQN